MDDKSKVNKDSLVEIEAVRRFGAILKEVRQLLISDAVSAEFKEALLEQFPAAMHQNHDEVTR